jgi:hypothetical protein
MASVLAIVSKAVFEKMAPKGVASGQVIAIDRYTSKLATFDTLTSGGALFLVTVRPPSERLWLVGVVENPKRRGSVWTGTANRSPIVDVTRAIPKLVFTTGHGIKAKNGTLGMSLQSPHVLTGEDENLLRSLANLPLAPARTRRLRVENHRGCWKRADFTAADKRQLSAPRYFTWDMDEDEYNGAECYDVADEATGKVVYQLWFFGLGGGAVYRAGSKEVVADIAEYGGAFVPVKPNRAFCDEMADAYSRAKKTLKLKTFVCFPEEDQKTKPAPTGRPKSIEAQLAEWRRATKAGSPPKTDEYFHSVIWDALGAPRWKRGDPQVFRPYPVRRWFELSSVAREALELLVDVGEESGGLACLGLPSDNDDLARFVGRTPPAGPLDEVVDIRGKPHPVWALVSDAIYKQRPVDEVAGLLERGLSTDKLASVWRALSEMPTVGTGTHHLKDYFPATEREWAQGSPWNTPASFEKLFAELLAAIAPQSKDADAHSESILERFRQKKWEQYTQLTFERDDAIAAIAALRHLHASAKTRGEVLSPKHDDLFETVMGATMAPLEVAYPTLDELPLERSSKIAGGHLQMLARYPTRGGLERAIHRLENPEWWLEAPFYDKVFTELVAKVGAEARPLLEAAIARTFPKANKHMRKVMVARMKKALAELKRRRVTGNNGARGA